MLKRFSRDLRARPRRASAVVAAVNVQPLEARVCLSAAPIITEFLANNQTGITDGNGNHSDWIEIYNSGDAAIDLNGWHLSDSAGTPEKWTFPSTNLAAGAYVLVFADGTGAADPAGYLHTNFSLSTDGENLTLRRPDDTVVSEFNTGGASFPKQFSDVSYGTSQIVSTTTLISRGASAKATVPANGSLDNNAWTAATYSDSTWLAGTTGVGFDGGAATASTANLVARWSAQTLNTLADGALVSSWAVTAGSGTAVQATTSKEPKLVKNQLNGRSVVRFDGVDDQMKITNQSLNGDVNFTVAMVFRTAAVGLSGSQWYNNTGIVDAEVGGVTNDWGLAISSQGAIGAGVGNPDTTLYSAGGLNDGNAHVVVFSKSGTATSLSIDGGAPVHGTAPAGARTINELVFGSLHTNINYFNGDIGEVRLYSAALNDDASRSLSYEMSTLWGLPIAAGAYTPLIGLDLQSAMSGLQTTADVRVPFTYAGSSAFSTLTLNVKYDDGFIAYLNGTEVARRNAPSGAITYTSTATSARDDSAALTAESIDISAYASLIQGDGAQNVLAIKLLNSSLADSDVLVIPELVASRVVSTGNAYMTTPTPGAPNVPGYAALAATPTFSVDHGYFSNAFTTTITSPTVGSTLVYTLDGSDPTLSNGTVVLPPASGLTTKTLSISSTSIFRAVAFLDTYLPSEVAAESYMFVADIVQQPEYTPAGAYWDVGMDTDVVNAAQTYSVQQALVAIPTISFSLPNADMFGPGGIYVNPLEHGDAWERAVSVEYFDPNNRSDEFTVNAGLRVEGGVSRDPSRPKKSFKLFFRAEYGASSLDYPVFGTSDPEQSFDHLVLRGGHSYSWANLGGDPAERAEYLRDEFARDTQYALDHQGSPGKFVQLFINGQYWGLYNLVEEIDADYAASRFGGAPDDYDIVEPDGNGGVDLDQGSLDAWNNLFSTADAAYSDGVITPAEYSTLAGLVDMKSLADYMLDIIYRGDNDAPVLIGSSTSPRNFLAVHDHVDPAGKFYFETWDGEISLDNVNYDRTEVFGNTNPGRLYQQLRRSVDFRQLMSDEVYRTFYNNGALTVSANKARYQNLVNEINVAIVGESARWGNAKQATVMTRDNQWLTEVNWILNTYMPQRSAVVLAQLTADFPEFTTMPPNVFLNGTVTSGGTVPSGSIISMTDTNSPTGAVYYTLDGSDPRLPGGAVSTLAQAYSGSFRITSATHLEARVLKNGTWSALQDLTFNTTPPLVRLSELMYHPPAPGAGAPTTDAEAYEFLEFVNMGDTAVAMGGMTFTNGIVGTMDANAVLAPGARGVFVSNLAAFQYVYGTSAQILGTYTSGKLDNDGEEVTLFDPNSGFNLVDVTYKDSWYKTTDGSGFSLVVNDLSQSQVDGTFLGNKLNWSASANLGGSPGLATATSSVAARKVFYNNSSFDGNSGAFAAADDAAIATDKVPLLPGQTATFANYTSYSKGLNGIMVDIAGLNADEVWAFTATADLAFRVSDASQVPVWSAAPAGVTITFRRAAGTNGSDRLEIAWPDNLIQGRWLEVTVPATPRTGLAAKDVFYFGNAPGESGNSTTDAIVDSADELAARNNPRTFLNPAPANFPYDYNRDGKVNAADELIARNGTTTLATALKLIGAPSPGALPLFGRPGILPVARPPGTTTIPVPGMPAATIGGGFSATPVAALFPRSSGLSLFRGGEILGSGTAESLVASPIEGVPQESEVP